MGAVHQHDRAQIAGGVGADNITPEAFLHQAGDIPGMVGMRVGEHHHIDRLGIEGQVPVALVAFRPFALIKAAVEQNFLTVDLDQMLRAGDGAGCAVKADLHGGNSLHLSNKTTAIVSNKTTAIVTRSSEAFHHRRLMTLL